jgi:cholesterol transport system auxiliary component
MRTSILAALAALAAGCFGGLKDEVPSPLIYRVNGPTLAAGAPIATDLLVVVETTAPGLDGTGIAGRWPGNRLDYLAGARWAEEVPALVQSALIEALQGTGRPRSVQGDLGRFRASHTLVVEVRRFEADYTGGGLPVAQVALSLTLGRASDRRVLAAFTVAASEAATENRQSTVVAALDAAFARAAADLAARSFEAIAADLASAEAARNSGSAPDQASANIAP